MLVEAGIRLRGAVERAEPVPGPAAASQTCTADAYLGPVISDYLAAVGAGSGRGGLEPARHDQRPAVWSTPTPTGRWTAF